MSTAQITVPQFLKVRRHIANLLKANSSTQEPTRIRQAENLLEAGVIDIVAVLAELEPPVARPQNPAVYNPDAMFNQYIDLDLDDPKNGGRKGHATVSCQHPDHLTSEAWSNYGLERLAIEEAYAHLAEAHKPEEQQ